MSIDGIGRPPVPPGAGGPTEGASAPASGTTAFRVSESSALEGPSALGPLERLERGELSLDEYLDARVDEALAPFQSQLSSEKLEFMRSALRAELETDPVLVEYVRRASAGLSAGEPSR